MKDLIKEFKDFVSRGNLVELAIAFVLATAFAPVVLSIVDNIFMPIIAAIVGEPDFSSLGFDIGPTKTPIVPVLIGPLEKTFLFWRKLFDAGVFTNPVVPPAVPQSECRLRTSLMATHTAEQIDFALETFQKIGRELGVV